MTLRGLPAVHRILADPRIAALVPLVGTSAAKAATGDVLGEIRLRAELDATIPPFEALVGEIARRLTRADDAALEPVLNGTGILLHTNLGRAPLAPEALAAIARVGAGYSNLEYDLASGARGSRYARVGALLREATGAEDALVVNNCAAAVLLVLDTFARGRETIVARGQAIEIGGSFRLPDVVRRSGAALVEVGATNKAYLHDVERALGPETGLLLRVHPSNYSIEGFVAEIPARELAALGRRVGVTSFEDLGGGALDDLSAYGLPPERTVSAAVADGLDLVAFSGDKLLGGPQAGIVVGRRAAIARLRANPLLRALRVGKGTLAALAATLRLHADPRTRARIPLYAMLGATPQALQARAEWFVRALGEPAVTIVALEGRLGGGAAPRSAIGSLGLALEPRNGDANALAERARRARPALVGRLEGRAFVVDLRTIQAAADETLLRILSALREA
jgi:L-seryl-tRNA(Ser) seleniumtransferase